MPGGSTRHGFSFAPTRALVDPVVVLWAVPPRASFPPLDPLTYQHGLGGIRGGESLARATDHPKRRAHEVFCP
jgi:hypothetical protein